MLKKLCAQEEHCYKQFNLNNGDPIKEYVPGYQGIITLEDDESMQLRIISMLRHFILLLN